MNFLTSEMLLPCEVWLVTVLVSSHLAHLSNSTTLELHWATHFNLRVLISAAASNITADVCVWLLRVCVLYTYDGFLIWGGPRPLSSSFPRGERESPDDFNIKNTARTTPLTFITTKTTLWQSIYLQFQVFSSALRKQKAPFWHPGKIVSKKSLALYL